MKDGLNPERKRMLRKLFKRQELAQKELDRINQAIQTLGREYWRECGTLCSPRVERLKEEVFK